MSQPAPTMPPGQQGRAAGRTPAHVASPTDTGMIPIIRQPEAPQQQRRIFSPGFGLRGPRRNRHVVTADELAAISMPIGDDGVIIGADPESQPAVLGLLAVHEVGGHRVLSFVGVVPRLPGNCRRALPCWSRRSSR